MTEIIHVTKEEGIAILNIILEKHDLTLDLIDASRSWCECCYDESLHEKIGENSYGVLAKIENWRFLCGV